MKSAPLGELLVKSNGERLGAGRELPLLSMTMRDGLVDQSSKFKKVVASRDLTAYKVVRQGQLVVGFPIDEAVLAIQRIHPAGIVSPAYDVWDVRTDLVDPDYLERYLKSPRAISYYVAKLRGSTARRRSLPKPDFDGMPVPLPPLPEQRRIASILDSASEARFKTKVALERASEMAELAFLDMFGLPEANPSGLPTARLAELGHIVTGNTPSRADPDNFGDDVEWIKSDNITVTDPFVTQAREGLSVKGRRIGRTVDEGSVLVTCIAGSPRSIGNAALTNRTVAFNQQINAFVPKRLEPLFALYQFRCGKTLVQRQSTGGMKGIVSKSKLEDVRFMVPPLGRQEEFSEIAARANELAELMERRLRKVDELLSSLQARAFQQVV